MANGDNQNTDYNEEILELLEMSSQENRELSNRSFIQSQKLHESTLNSLDDLREEMNQTNSLIRRLTEEKMNEIMDTHLASVDGDIFDSFITRLKSTTFNVRIISALNDIVMPLREKMGEVYENNRNFQLQMHNDNMRIRMRMIDAFAGRTKEQKRGLRLAIETFMMHPVWNTMKGALKAMSGIGTGFFKVLFGRRNKQLTIQEEILKATQQQTEFLMSGRIEEQRAGFFKQFIDRGVVGGLANAISQPIASAAGLDKKRAEETELKLARGEEIGVGERILNFISQQQKGSVQIGQQGGVTDPNQQIMRKERFGDRMVDRFFNPNKDKKQETQQAQQSPALELINDFKLSFDNFAENLIESSENIENVLRSFSMAAVPQLEAIENNAHERKTVGYFQEMTELNNSVVQNAKKQTSILEGIQDVNKDNLEESERTNRHLFTQKLISLLNLGVNTIKGVGSMIGTGLNALGWGGAALLAGKNKIAGAFNWLRNKIGSRSGLGSANAGRDIPTKRTAGNFLRASGIGRLLSAGSILLSPSDAEENEGMLNKTGQVIGGMLGWGAGEKFLGNFAKNLMRVKNPIAAGGISIVSGLIGSQIGSGAVKTVQEFFENQAKSDTLMGRVVNNVKDLMDSGNEKDATGRRYREGQFTASFNPLSPFRDIANNFNNFIDSFSNNRDRISQQELSEETVATLRENIRESLPSNEKIQKELERTRRESTNNQERLINSNDRVEQAIINLLTEVKNQQQQARENAESATLNNDPNNISIGEATR